MNTFDFTQGPITHNLKDPHSKALEPDCLSPHFAITTQSLRRGEGALFPIDCNRKSITGVHSIMRPLI